MKNKIRKKVAFILVILGIFLISGEQINIHIEKTKYEDFKKNTDNKDERIIDFDSLLKINKDVAAWIEIPGTDIDYPIVQADNNDFYLNHDLKGDYSQFGSIYMDERYYKTEPFKKDNLIIYGHNMGHWNDSMFGQLEKYKDSKFYKKHKVIKLYTKQENPEYQIIGIIRTTSSSKWYQFTDIDKEHKYKDMISYIKDNSLYDCKIPKKENAKFITLSTCDYDGRYKLLVIGIRGN